MKLKLNPSSTIKEIKKKFHSQFEGVKIEFYKNSHQENEGSSIQDQLDEDITIAELNPKFQAEVIQFNEENQVIEVENVFKEKLNLNIQVFRRSNDVWLQTSKTDNWTLKVQNQKGINSQKH